jgi:N,N-dimethylformamidase beta subunit-like, C-terminal
LLSARYLFVAPLLVVAGAAVGSTGGDARLLLTQTLAPCGPHHFVPDRGRPPNPIEAYFTRRSYAPGEFARLNVVRVRGATTLRTFRAFVGQPPPKRADVMTGVPVGAPVRVQSARIEIRIRSWESGLYFARLAARGGVGYAPFIVRAAVAGENNVAVVLPTNTWEAYNFLDEDGNGFGDTWYADPRVDTVRFNRPFLHRGVPPHLGSFPYWVWLYGKHADYLADDDLDAAPSAEALARLYKLIVFAGHEEYVTSREFSPISRYRDLGGNLAFLSANNFYARVVRAGQAIRCTAHFRDIGRPEAALVGVQYLDWNHGIFRNRRYVVTGARRAPWFFRGTRLQNGSRFGFSYGVEIDTLAPSSPRGIAVLAELPNIFGAGRTAKMTFYTSPSGAKVFAAGAMNFDSSQSAVTDRLLLNLWNFLSR